MSLAQELTAESAEGALYVPCAAAVKRPFRSEVIKRPSPSAWQALQ